MPKQGQVDLLPLPQNTNPPLRCFKIYLPDDSEYLQTFYGKMRELSLWGSYDRDEAHSGRLVADVWKRVQESIKLCVPDCGCGGCGEDCNDCGDCDDCGGQTSMADSVKDIVYDPSQCAYKVIYCSGAEAFLPPIPPDCAVEPPPPVIPDNGKTRCWKLGVMAHFTNTFFDSFLSVVCPFIFTPTDPLLAGAIMAWMVSKSISITLYPALFHYAAFQLPADGANTCNLIAGMEDVFLANIMDCCWTTSELVDADFLACVRLNMNGGEVYDDRSAPEQAYLRQQSIFMGIFDAGWWYDYYWTLLADAEHPDYVVCGDFVSCGGQEGCLPEALYQSRYFRWNDVMMEGGSDNCYGAGIYTPCTPFNARLVADEIAIQFTEQVCFKDIYFTFAGNGQCLWLDVDYLVDGNIVGSQTNVIQRTKCTEGSSYSGGFILPSPLEGNRISIKPTRTSGANPAFGVDIHCIKVTYAYLGS